MTLKIFQPSLCCFIIMSSCIDNTVMFIFIREITTVLAAVKCKLKDFHSRISTVFQHFQDTLCKETKIFCNHTKLSNLFIQCMEEVKSRSFFPFTILCGLITIRDCIIFIKSAKMIDSYYIIKFQAVSHTLHPPAIIVFFKFLPVIQRISPQLTRSGKSIRRTACNGFRVIILIKLQHLRICPRIGTVQCDIDRNISDNTDSLLICICFQFSPLCSETILLKAIEFNLFCQFFFCFFYSF